jgi:hypothetical protein
MRNVPHNSSKQNQNTHFMSNNFFPENLAVCEMMRKNMVQPDRQLDNNIIRCMRFACWITKATDTQSQCVILIAFPQQQWLRERA